MMDYPKLEQLSVRGLVKEYRDFRLGPIDLELHPGRVYGLLGPNGAGKTTFLNCLSGQARIKQGELLWNGRPILWGDRSFLERLGSVREVPVFYEELTVKQTLYLASRLFSRWDWKATQELRRFLELTDCKKVRELSKGMRVKLSLIVCLSHGSDMVLLDEGTSGLDPDTREEVIGFINELSHGRGICVLFSSHLFEDVERVSDEVHIIRSGRLVFGGGLAAIRNMRLCRFSTPSIELGPLAAHSLSSWHNGSVSWHLLPAHLASAASETRLSSLAESVEPASIRDIYFALRNVRHE